MTMILVPESGEEDVQINRWNWRPTVELIKSLSLIDDEMATRLCANGCGGAVNDSQAKKIAIAIASQLEMMRPGDRLLMDQTLTAAPKSGKLDDPTIYSASFDWLVTFQRFCETSGGFEAV